MRQLMSALMFFIVLHVKQQRRIMTARTR